MAHTCPECGQWCYCGGDIDDCGINHPDDQMNCSHWMTCGPECTIEGDILSDMTDDDPDDVTFPGLRAIALGYDHPVSISQTTVADHIRDAIEMITRLEKAGMFRFWILQNLARQRRDPYRTIKQQMCAGLTLEGVIVKGP